MIIHTQGLSKIYNLNHPSKEVIALTSLNLQVPRNSIFGFIGPNGAGKTTTIKLLLGLIQPTGGSATILGYDIARESLEIRKRIGYLPQNPRFYEYMTARETLRFKAQFYYAGPKTEREEHLLSAAPIAAALSLQALYMLFYLALALMLGTFFSSRVPVLAISFGVLLSQPFIDNSLKSAPWIAWVLPAKLPELARFAHRGEPLPSILTIIVVLILTSGFLWLAIWRFNREEF